MSAASFDPGPPVFPLESFVSLFMFSHASVPSCERAAHGRWYSCTCRLAGPAPTAAETAVDEADEAATGGTELVADSTGTEAPGTSDDCVPLIAAGVLMLPDHWQQIVTRATCLGSTSGAKSMHTHSHVHAYVQTPTRQCMNAHTQMRSELAAFEAHIRLRPHKGNGDSRARI